MQLRKLSKKEAIKLHREMWTDMRKRLGNKPSEGREWFKRRWCATHFPDIDIKHNCLLCEYAVQQIKNEIDKCDGEEYCQYCPIEWPHGEKDSAYFCECGSGIVWSKSPISDILALPERKEDEP